LASSSKNLERPIAQKRPTVYERSLYLSILFASQKHTTAIILALLDDIYPKVYLTSPKLKSTNHSHHRHISLLISLINHLITQYPSQILYRQHYVSLPKDWISLATRKWLDSLTCSLRSGNYYKIGFLTNERYMMSALQLSMHTDTSGTSVPTQLHDNLSIRAFKLVIDSLLTKTRASAWRIVRSAYRELWLEESYNTRRWLCDSLAMDSPRSSESFEKWLAGAENLNELRRKEGTQDKWIVMRVR